MDDGDLPVTTINALDDESCVTSLLLCCTHRAWAESVCAKRPFQDLQALLAFARGEIDRIPVADLPAALSGYDALGERPHGATAEMSSSEEARLLAGDPENLEVIWRGSVLYEHTFGFRFVIAAQGRPDTEIMAELSRRLLNGKDVELEVARKEMGTICAGRLCRMFARTRGESTACG